MCSMRGRGPTVRGSPCRALWATFRSLSAILQAVGAEPASQRLLCALKGPLAIVWRVDGRGKTVGQSQVRGLE